MDDDEGGVLGTHELVVQIEGFERFPRPEFEWLSALAMYVGLLTLFIHIGLNAHASENTILLCAMGLLCFIFGGGLLVTLAKLMSAISGGKASEDTATN